MKATSIRAANVLIVTQCSFTRLALSTVLTDIQFPSGEKINVATGAFFNKNRMIIDFIICADDLFNEVSLKSISKIKESLKYASISSKMIFLTSHNNFQLSYFISSLCKKNGYCTSIDKPIENIAVDLRKILNFGFFFSELPPQSLILTVRERDIIIELIKQKKPAYLSKKYSINQKTISAHKMSALRKLNVAHLNNIFSLNALT